MSATLDEIQPKGETGHPPGLYALFATEMWERFSYYGMRALLVLYLTKHFEMARTDALQVYATFTGLVYFTPLIGGYLADAWLGQRKAVFIGGILMAIGQFCLFASPDYLNYGLGLLIVGNGFFKPNISTMVGTLYPKGDHRRDGAYTIFYMGINLGAGLSPLVCGYLGEQYAFGYGFAAAGVGMIIGTLTFFFTQKLLGTGGFPPKRDVLPETRLGLRDWLDIIGMSVFCLAFVYGFLLYGKPIVQPLWDGYLLPMVLLGIVVFLFILYLIMNRNLETRPIEETMPAEDPPTPKKLLIQEWQRVGVIFIISTFSIVFWMGFEQAGGTMTLFADEKTDLKWLGLDLKASYFQSINPIFIISLAPLFAVLWTYLNRANFPLRSTTKQGLGLILLGTGFAVMYLADKDSANGRVSPLWLVGVYFLNTVAELFVSPIGLSLVNKLAPARVASLMMAVWFCCTAFANYLAGVLEKLIEPLHLNLWLFLVATSIIPGILLVALTPVLKKMGHGHD